MTVLLVALLGLFLAIAAFELHAIHYLQQQTEEFRGYFPSFQEFLRLQETKRQQEMATLTALVEHLAEEVQVEAIRQALKTTHDAFSVAAIKPFQP